MFLNCKYNTKFLIFTAKSLNQSNMRKNKIFLLAMITCIIVSCNSQKPETEPKGKDKIGPRELTLTSDMMTPEVLWAMGRIGEYSLSPDHSKIVYAVTYYSVPENRSGSTLYIMNADGSDNKVLVESKDSQYSPQWRPDGKKIGFLAAKDEIGRAHV